jgi:hypothetical protein
MNQHIKYVMRMNMFHEFEHSWIVSWIISNSWTMNIHDFFMNIHELWVIHDVNPCVNIGAKVIRPRQVM